MPLGRQVGLSQSDIVLAGDSQNGSRPPNFRPCLLWPDCWMDHDATWRGGRSRLRPHCARWGSSSPSPKGAQHPPIFGPYLLWPNGWMDQDATWQGGWPRSKQHCVRWGPSSPPQKGDITPSIFGPCLLWPRLPISVLSSCSNFTRSFTFNRRRNILLQAPATLNFDL